VSGVFFCLIQSDELRSTVHDAFLGAQGFRKANWEFFKDWSCGFNQAIGCILLFCLEQAVLVGQTPIFVCLAALCAHKVGDHSL
jgi:hypothetical protein